MRRLILADLHSNLEALNAVLKDAADQYDEIVCCGDVAGYGGSPNEVIEWSRANCKTIVRGNHDRACGKDGNLLDFNERAGAAVIWTRDSLKAANCEWLSALPPGPLVFDDYELAHGSPLDEDEYLIVSYDVAPLSGVIMRPVCFVGHTHVQSAWEWNRGGLRQLPVPRKERERVIELAPDRMYLINPGSVGQPRDHDPRAGYAIWDTAHRTLKLRRVEYDIKSAQERIRAAGLHPWLADRLAFGR
ncbi:MAG: metallophosphoesterase family protein [Bryobacteraceae bacterium]|nr:metallophosphoesterase family protein [Bryobacteraceae bacterium]